MIELFAGMLLAAAPAAGPDPDVACAFERARALAAGEEAPEAIADAVVAACTGAREDGAADDGTRRFRIRQAALAIVYRSRGIDKRPADGPIAVPGPRALDIPDEIAPALLPYLRCLIASQGIPMKADGKTVFPPEGVAVGSDCAGFRAQAAQNSEVLLRRHGMKEAAERRAFIERSLADIDAFHAAWAPPHSNDENDAED